jgi:hypothetical protein
MSTPPFEARVQRELAAVLERSSDVGDPDGTARGLLDKDTAQFQLVGLRRHGGRAVFHDTVLRKLVAASFDDSGVVDRDDARDLSSQPDVERWVFEQDSDHWTWLHPRFSWVFEDGPSD